MKKKKTVKRIIGWIVLALVAAGLAILPNLARRAANPDQASVLTAKAEQGEIEYTLAGKQLLRKLRARFQPPPRRTPRRSSLQ